MVRADLGGAFSTTGALEGAWALNTAHFVVLRQQLVDCDIVDQSCDDGWAHKQCFFLRREEHRLDQERYSNVGTKGTCSASSCTVGFAQGIDTEVTTKNVQELKDALAQLPVSIAIGTTAFTSAVMVRCRGVSSCIPAMSCTSGHPPTTESSPWVTARTAPRIIGRSRILGDPCGLRVLRVSGAAAGVDV